LWVAVSADAAACTVGKPSIHQPGRPCFGFSGRVPADYAAEAP